MPGDEVTDSGRSCWDIRALAEGFLTLGVLVTPTEALAAVRWVLLVVLEVLVALVALEAFLEDVLVAAMTTECYS